MNKRVKIISLAAILIIAFFASDMLASAAEMWFSSSPVDVRANRTETVLPGRHLWIVVYDPGRNIDPAVPDIIPATEIMVGSVNSRLWLNREWLAEMKGEGDLARRVRYLRETGPNTGLFVFSEPIIIAARQLTTGIVPTHTHIPAPWLPAPQPQMWITVDAPPVPVPVEIIRRVPGELGRDRMQFQLGVGAADRHVLNPSHPHLSPLYGRFIDGDTLIGIYQSVLNDAVSASAFVEISRTEATITWDRPVPVYPHITGPAIITVRDADENLNPGAIEYVPVFIIVNPGTWNPVQIVAGAQTAAARMRSATSFQMLLESGGVVQTPPLVPPTWLCRGTPIRWYNIYSPDRHIVYAVAYGPGTANFGRRASFATLHPQGATKVIFLARETGINTGIFELTLENIQRDLGFSLLRPEYVLAAFYLDANDFSDMAIATAYAAIDRLPPLPTIFFADAGWTERTELSLGRDRINVGVDYSPLNRDHHAREEIVVQVFTPHSTDRDWIRLYEAGVRSPHFRSERSLGLGPVIWDEGIVRDPWDPAHRDLGLTKFLAAFGRSAIFVRMNAVRVKSYPTEPEIITEWLDHRRVVYAEIEVTRTRLAMSFVNHRGEEVPGYTIGERVFIRVNDNDLNRNVALRDGIPAGVGIVVFNLRTNRFVTRELRESDINSGIFHTVDPIRLTGAPGEVDHLDARTGDTIHAFFVDPSDLSDARIITTQVVAIVNRPPIAVADSYRVLMDGVLTVPAPGVLGNDSDPDRDPLTAELVTNVVALLPHTLVFMSDGSFTFTPGPGFIGTVTFTYRALDGRGGRSEIVTVTITVREEEVVLDVDDFRVVHKLGSEFYFIGEGIADTFTVTIFNMLGREVRRIEARDVAPGDIVKWDGRCEAGNLLAKGPYIFVAVLRDGAIHFTIRGTVFRK